MSAVVLSYAVLREQYSWAHLVEVACVLLAILLIARDRSPMPFEKTEDRKGGAL